MFEFESDGERGEIRDAVLNVTNEFYIWGEVESTFAGRIQCWLNGRLPGRWRISTGWRFFRVS